MASQTYTLSASVTMERNKYNKEDDYIVKGTGDVSGCARHFSTYGIEWIEVYIEGQFDTIQDNCFSHSYIKYAKPRNNGYYKHIGNNCFCSNKLEQIILPETLETIGHNNFNGVFTSFNIPSKIKDFPADNLKDCNKLKTITVSEGNTSYKVVDGVLYTSDLTVAVFCPNALTGTIILQPSVKHIGDYCFYGCGSLKNLIIPPSVETIGNYAFANSSFRKLIIPNSVTTIGVGCFENALIDESLKLSTQVRVLPEDCFKKSKINKFSFPFCNVTQIGKSAIGNIQKDIIPPFVSFESLKSLGKLALNYCNQTDTFEFFSTLDKIDVDAFMNTKDNVKLRYFSSCPLRLPANAFRGLSDNATLIVPKGSKIIFQNAAPWSSISNIQECELDMAYDDNNIVMVSDETHLRRLRSVANSKVNADRYFLKTIIEDTCLNFLYVDSDEEYKAALELIKYNQSFSPAIVPNLEQKMCLNWRNKYKLKLASRTLFENPSTYAIADHSEIISTIPSAAALTLSGMLVASTIPEMSTPSVQVVFNDDIQRQLQSVFTLAKSSLKIAVSWFTNYSIFNQIKELAANGIKVQLITNNDLINNGGYCLNLNELIDAGVEISLVEYPNLLHHKFCIIDDDIVVNGSYNWTRLSAKNYENVTIIRNDADAIMAFADEFENLLQNAEYKCIKEMPEFVQERPEYDRSAFRQYVTEELDAEARETLVEREKITALQKAASLNSGYLEKINPEAKKKYADAFKTVNESVAMQNTIAAMVENKPLPQDSSSVSQSVSSQPSTSRTKTVETVSSTPVQKSVTIVTRSTQQSVNKVKASDLVMVLDVSGSMANTYRAGHVHSIAKKALSASFAIAESKEVSLWTFGDNAQFIDNVGIDSIAKIDRVQCKSEGTVLNNFVRAAENSIKDNSLVIIFTDDDKDSIANAIPAMQKKSNVFWQIIVYGVSYDNINNSISDVANTSVVSLTEYALKTDEEISSLLLKDYIDWKKNSI